MSMNDASVREYLQQAIDFSHVNRVLQKPAFVRLTLSNEPKDVHKSAIRLSSILAAEPTSVGRQAEDNCPSIVNEILKEWSAFVDIPCQSFMHSAKCRQSAIEFFKVSDAGPVSGMFAPGFTRRTDHRRFGEPIFKSLKLAIQSKELVQRRGASARKADDDQRAMN